MKKIFFLLITGLAGVSVLAQNSADVEQRGRLNNSEVEQDGFDNTSLARQIGKRNEAFILQAGEANVNDIRQMTGSEGEKPSNQNSFDLFQEGVENQSKLIQGQGGGSEAYVTQVGEGNILSGPGNYGREQNNEYARQAWNSSLKLEQFGSGNLTGLEQTAGFSQAEILQTGEENTVDLVQSDSYLEDAGDRKRPGKGNYGDDFAYGNEAFVMQEGAANKTAVYQVGDYYGPVSNKARVSIFGEDNRTFTLQSGSFNKSDVFVEGEMNRVEIVQLGHSHDADVHQVGNANRAIVRQTDFGGLFW
ncbi:MAG: hypothetical protein ACOCWA_07635 [Bacteroidota bacterium]